MKVVFDITKTINQMTPIPHQQSDIGKALKKTGLNPNKKRVIQERKHRKNKQKMIRLCKQTEKA